MRTSFLGHVWESFRGFLGFGPSLLSLVLGLGLWIWKPDAVIPLAPTLVVALLLIAFVLTLGDAALRAWRTGLRDLPRIIHCRPGSSASNPLCLLEPCELFAHGILVSFSYIDEGQFEVLIGYGSVINVQDDGRIQVVLEEHAPGQSDVVERLSKNTGPILNRVRVKPVVRRLGFGVDNG